MRAILLIFLIAIGAQAQSNLRVAFSGNGAPTGACGNARYVDRDTGLEYLCDETTHTWGAPIPPTVNQDTTHRMVSDTQIAAWNSAAGGGVPTTRTVNAHPLSADVVVTKADVGLNNVANTDTTNASNITSGALPCPQHPALTGDVTTSGCAATIRSSVSLTTPNINIASGTSLAVTGALSSSGTAGIGYAAGSGGTISQITSKSTGVTLNKITGAVTMVNTALAANTSVSFTVTNSTVAATDVPMVAIKSGATANAYIVTVGAVAAGSFVIQVRNVSAGSLSEAIVINFVVLKGSVN